MRGLDTNILVRYLTQDDSEQSAAASRWIEDCEARGERLYLNTIILCELVWTLRGSRYGFGRADLAEVLERLLAIPLFEIQSRDQVHFALADYRTGRADFADYLIGRENRAAGCDDTVSFDGKLRGAEGFRVLP